MAKRLIIVLVLSIVVVGISVASFYYKLSKSKEPSAPLFSPGSTVNVNDYTNVVLSTPQMQDLGNSLSGSTLKLSVSLVSDGGTSDIIGFAWGYADGDYSFPTGSAQVDGAATTGDTIHASITALSPNTTYYYEWYAFGGGGYSLLGAISYVKGSFTTGNSLN